MCSLHKKMEGRGRLTGAEGVPEGETLQAFLTSQEIGVHKMRLMTNNPVKRVGLEAYGLEITENVAIETTPNPYNERYLRTKKERMGHTLHFNK